MKVWLNGCFDILHIGHINLLEFAKSFGYVKVGIDTDSRVKKMKGEKRPFNNLENRIKMLQSLKFVDEVVYFDSDEELEKILSDYSPDIMVIGDDYRGKKIIGSQFIKEIKFFEKIPNISTTKILNFSKIKGD